ncbi:MAG: YggS family pyridoxal phosphate-dependent enzyme [Saprospiraceae bacterium]|nr:YggS family pyridoxal phosphate-dependent enzyme [Saprospiraceae bacterium]
MVNEKKYIEVLNLSIKYKADLLVVTKNQSTSDILKLYELGHRLFGENKVQMLLDRRQSLPEDITWHMIGHLQKNKIRYIIDWISCIQSIDSWSLAEALNQHAREANRILPVFLEIKIAKEYTKYGFNRLALMEDLKSFPAHPFPNLHLAGCMGMASFTDNKLQIQSEFADLKNCFDEIKMLFDCCSKMQTLSMGMSGDYQIALDSGSNMIRVGSLLFSQ